MQISQITRRDIFDAMMVQGVNWSGRLAEPDFLARIYDLKKIRSTDGRFQDAYGDIWQHRINNFDWDDDWVFDDGRLGLMTGDDETLLRFLCETIHPVVRPDVEEAEMLRQLYNQYLRNDGYQIVERARISGKPVYAGHYIGICETPGVSAVREVLSGTDPGYVAQQITRMEAAVITDPGLAIGTAKELLETCCKTILTERGIPYGKDDDILELIKLTRKTLELTPDDIPDKAKAAETIKRLLSNLATITQGVAELRNLYGTGHGQAAKTKGLQPRHAKLAVGAASTLAAFLVETHNEKA